jgi:hypothetical protein
MNYKIFNAPQVFLKVQNIVPYFALKNVTHSIKPHVKVMATWVVGEKKNNASYTIYSKIYICPTTDYVVGSKVKRTTGVGFQLNHKNYSLVPCILMNTKRSLGIFEHMTFSSPPLIQKECLNFLHLV